MDLAGEMDTRMSNTQRTLTFGVVVTDYKHWTHEHRLDRLDADEDGGGSYDDWAISGLEIVMLEAGNAYIREHPDLFQGELI